MSDHFPMRHPSVHWWLPARRLTTGPFPCSMKGGQQVEGTRARQDDHAEPLRGQPAHADQDRSQVPALTQDLRTPISPATLLSLHSLAGIPPVSQLLPASLPRRPPAQPIVSPPAVKLPGAPSTPPVQLPTPPGPPSRNETSLSTSPLESPETPAVGETEPTLETTAVPPPAPPPPSDGSPAPPPGYDPAQARATVEAQVSRLKGVAVGHGASITQRAAETKAAILGRAAAVSATIRSGVAEQKAQISAGFARKRGDLGAQVEAERQAMQAATEQERQLIERSTTKRVEVFATETQAQRTQIHQKLEEERERPAKAAYADATRAEADVAAGSQEARDIGRREAAKYGSDDTGGAQAAAAA